MPPYLKFGARLLDKDVGFLKDLKFNAAVGFAFELLWGLYTDSLRLPAFDTLWQSTTLNHQDMSHFDVDVVRDFEYHTLLHLLLAPKFKRSAQGTSAIINVELAHRSGVAPYHSQHVVTQFAQGALILIATREKNQKLSGQSLPLRPPMLEVDRAMLFTDVSIIQPYINLNTIRLASSDANVPGVVPSVVLGNLPKLFREDVLLSQLDCSDARGIHQTIFREVDETNKGVALRIELHVVKIEH